MSIRPSGRAIGVLLILTVATGCARDAGQADLPERVGFNRHIRPILSNSCYPCHGPDSGARQADLRLDDREVAISSRRGVRAIVPGDARRSEVVRRINHPDPTERMPPSDSERSINDRERALLGRWIEQGAEYEPHWSFVPPRRPQEPQVARHDWPRNPIDRFILARLEQEGIEPSLEADAITLARRLSFDLTGLPPAPGQVDTFVDDHGSDARGNGSDAYDELVERLIASPHYGERMALDWLDQVRYADSNGYHSDEDRPVYAYRDYVIAAFNDNLPFDEFTREQLAGDLLPAATQRQLVASAFNRLNQITAEGGAQPKEYRAKYNADRVRTVASVWMGATLGCAECHDHKFDPFTSRDFYSLAAFFADLEEEDVYLGLNAWWDPVLLLPTEEDSAELQRLEARIAHLQSTLKRGSPELDRHQAEWEDGLRRSVLGHGWMGLPRFPGHLWKPDKGLGGEAWGHDGGTVASSRLRQ